MTEVYQKSQEIKATAMELSLPPNKVKKLLITGNVISYSETEQIQALLQQGRTMEEIQGIMGLSYSTISGLPFQYTLKTGRNGSYTKELFIDRRGISYSYSLLWRFGLIMVPEEIEKKLSGKNEG